MEVIPDEWITWTDENLSRGVDPINLVLLLSSKGLRPYKDLRLMQKLITWRLLDIFLTANVDFDVTRAPLDFRFEGWVKSLAERGIDGEVIMTVLDERLIDLRAEHPRFTQAILFNEFGTVAAQDSSQRGYLLDFKSACERGFLEEVTIYCLCLPASEVNVEYITRHTSETVRPLSLAAANNHVDVMRVLLLHGAEVGLLDPRGRTALHMAAMKGSTEACLLLIENGATIFDADFHGNNSIHLAAQANHMETMKSLLDKAQEFTREIIADKILVRADSTFMGLVDEVYEKLMEMKLRANEYRRFEKAWLCDAARLFLKLVDDRVRRLLPPPAEGVITDVLRRFDPRPETGVFLVRRTVDARFVSTINSAKELLIMIIFVFRQSVIDSVNKLSRSALHLACFENRIDSHRSLIRLLVDVYGCNVALLDRNGLSAFDLLIQEKRDLDQPTTTVLREKYLFDRRSEAMRLMSTSLDQEELQLAATRRKALLDDAISHAYHPSPKVWDIIVRSGKVLRTFYFRVKADGFDEVTASSDTVNSNITSSAVASPLNNNLARVATAEEDVWQMCEDSDSRNIFYVNLSLDTQMYTQHCWDISPLIRPFQREIAYEYYLKARCEHLRRVKGWDMYRCRKTGSIIYRNETGPICKTSFVCPDELHWQRLVADAKPTKTLGYGDEWMCMYYRETSGEDDEESRALRIAADLAQDVSSLSTRVLDSATQGIHFYYRSSTSEGRWDCPIDAISLSVFEKICSTVQTNGQSSLQKFYVCRQCSNAHILAGNKRRSLRFCETCAFRCHSGHKGVNVGGFANVTCMCAAVFDSIATAKPAPTTKELTLMKGSTTSPQAALVSPESITAAKNRIEALINENDVPGILTTSSQQDKAEPCIQEASLSRCICCDFSSKQKEMRKKAFIDLTEKRRQHKHDELLRPVFAPVPLLWPDGSPKKESGWRLCRRRLPKTDTADSLLSRAVVVRSEEDDKNPQPFQNHSSVKELTSIMKLGSPSDPQFEFLRVLEDEFEKISRGDDVQPIKEEDAGSLTDDIDPLVICDHETQEGGDQDDDNVSVTDAELDGTSASLRPSSPPKFQTPSPQAGAGVSVSEIEEKKKKKRQRSVLMFKRRKDELKNPKKKKAAKVKPFIPRDEIPTISVPVGWFEVIDIEEPEEIAVGERVLCDSLKHGLPKKYGFVIKSELVERKRAPPDGGIFGMLSERNNANLTGPSENEQAPKKQDQRSEKVPVFVRFYTIRYDENMIASKEEDDEVLHADRIEVLSKPVFYCNPSTGQSTWDPNDIYQLMEYQNQQPQPDTRTRKNAKELLRKLSQPGSLTLSGSEWMVVQKRSNLRRVFEEVDENLSAEFHFLFYVDTEMSIREEAVLTIQTLYRQKFYRPVPSPGWQSSSFSLQRGRAVKAAEREMAGWSYLRRRSECRGEFKDVDDNTWTEFVDRKTCEHFYWQAIPAESPRYEWVKPQYYEEKGANLAALAVGAEALFRRDGHKYDDNVVVTRVRYDDETGEPKYDIQSSSKSSDTFDFKWVPRSLLRMIPVTSEITALRQQERRWIMMIRRYRSRLQRRDQVSREAKVRHEMLRLNAGLGFRDAEANLMARIEQAKLERPIQEARDYEESLAKASKRQRRKAIEEAIEHIKNDSKFKMSRSDLLRISRNLDLQLQRNEKIDTRDRMDKILKEREERRNVRLQMLEADLKVSEHVMATPRSVARRHICRELHFAMHRQAENFVICQWGCGAWVKAGFEQLDHQSKVCPKRIITCALSCGLKLTEEEWMRSTQPPLTAAELEVKEFETPREDDCGFASSVPIETFRDHHESNLCPKRVVECPRQCLEFMTFDSLERHMRELCVKRPAEPLLCRLGCGTEFGGLVESLLAAEEDRLTHETEACDRRMVRCTWKFNDGSFCTALIRADERHKHRDYHIQLVGVTLYTVPGTYLYTVSASNGPTIKVQLWGAGGGSGHFKDRKCGHGGGGAFVEAIIKVCPFDVLEIAVGAGGASGEHGLEAARVTNIQEFRRKEADRRRMERGEEPPVHDSVDQELAIIENSNGVALGGAPGGGEGYGSGGLWAGGGGGGYSAITSRSSKAGFNGVTYVVAGAGGGGCSNDGVPGVGVDGLDPGILIDPRDGDSATIEGPGKAGATGSLFSAKWVATPGAMWQGGHASQYGGGGGAGFYGGGGGGNQPGVGGGGGGGSSYLYMPVVVDYTTRSGLKPTIDPTAVDEDPPRATGIGEWDVQDGYAGAGALGDLQITRPGRNGAVRILKSGYF